MFEQIRAWLNGKRDYFRGVAIYIETSNDKSLAEVLAQGPNEYRKRRLYKELFALYEKLKVASDANKLAQSANKSAPNELPYHTLAAKAKVIQNNDTPVNPELYESCKREADIEYKKVMNKRAVLFSMADSEGFEDPNTEAKINDRSKLAIDIVTGYQKISDLYDRVNFVKSHGHLPDQGGIGEKEYISLPDHLVKLRLDNARKAYNKIKAKERTPKRVVLMQKHEENIKRLEEQWKSLKASLNL